MNRDHMLAALDGGTWDLIVIGGGATGLGAAVDASARGYRTLLLEQGDFAQGTSSRSTKLVHGGVRYLKQGNVALVLEALQERGLMYGNAPHLVGDLGFVVPRYRWWEGPFYGIGLKLYDRLARRLSFAPSRLLKPAATIDRIPNVETRHLLGGVLYYDGLFDDARMAITLARTAADAGAVLLNYTGVCGLLKAEGDICGVQCRDAETGREYEVRARAVINATGIFADHVRTLDDAESTPLIAPSQGVHLVLDRAFLPGDTALMVPQTDDGRVLFAIPWLGRIVVGTTDTAVPGPELEPRPRREEIDFILRNAARYLERDPTADDILSAFAGQRPLVVDTGLGDSAATKTLNREHSVLISDSGLVTIAGGKWTTYRRMAEDVVDAAAALAELPARPSPTRDLHLRGWLPRVRAELEPAPQRSYGADLPQLRQLLAAESGWEAPLHPRLPYAAGEVVWAARCEMARTVEDVLARRTRSLLLDARASVEAAPRAAALLAAELGRDAAWQRAQVEAYESLARGYLPDA